VQAQRVSNSAVSSFGCFQATSQFAHSSCYFLPNFPPTYQLPYPHLTNIGDSMAAPSTIWTNLPTLRDTLIDLKFERYQSVDVIHPSGFRSGEKCPCPGPNFSAPIFSFCGRRSFCDPQSETFISFITDVLNHLVFISFMGPLEIVSIVGAGISCLGCCLLMGKRRKGKRPGMIDLDSPPNQRKNSGLPNFPTRSHASVQRSQGSHLSVLEPVPGTMSSVSHRTTSSRGSSARL
jgi:hypothetical protein